jgi:hypothetical protein
MASAARLRRREVPHNLLGDQDAIECGDSDG